jgi:RNA polymerase subunit RPABC4/transcription elongation factor Spt4
MSPESVNTIATIAGIIVAILGAFLFAFWVAMGIWAFNDIRSRSRDWLSILLAVLLVMVFPIIGLVLYTMIRPKETLAEVYDRALEEEALLRELEVTLACSSCGIPVKEAWVYCPQCHNQLQHSCISCGRLVRNEWDICVYCGAEQRAGEVRSPSTPTVIRSPNPTLAQPSAPGVLPQPIVDVEATPSQAPRRRTTTRRNPFMRENTTSELDNEQT